MVSMYIYELYRQLVSVTIVPHIQFLIFIVLFIKAIKNRKYRFYFKLSIPCVAYDKLDKFSELFVMLEFMKGSINIIHLSYLPISTQQDRGV